MLARIIVQEYSHLHSLQLADNSTKNQPIDVLIRSDYYWDFAEGDPICGRSAPTVINSKFGWLLSGLMKETSYTTRTSSNVVSNLSISVFDTIPHDVVNEDDEMLNTLKQFWEKETIGIKESTTDVQLTIASEFMKPKISHNGRYYKVGLLWKDNCMPTSDNYDFSVLRF